MGFTRFSFTKLWTNPTDFPTVETDETQVRADMQDLHDQSRQGLNNLMTALENQSAAEHLGARTAGGTGQSTVQAQLDALHADSQTRAKQTQVDALEQASHTHANAAVINATQVSLTENLAAAYDRLVNLFGAVASVTAALGADDTTIPTSKAVQNAITASGNMPGGGGAGQALTKASGSDYDYQWADVAPAAHAARHAKNGADPITPAGIGAVNLSGDTMKGALLMALAANGYMKLLKNHSSSLDYGTELSDYSADGSHAILRVSGVNKKVSFYDSAKGWFDILHSGNHSALNVPQMVVGVYSGDGEEERTISLGFTPKAVLLKSRYASDNLVGVYSEISREYEYIRGPIMMTSHADFVKIEDGDMCAGIVTNGFKVLNDDYCFLNNSGETYDYVAWG